jgi:hypothetical protein
MESNRQSVIFSRMKEHIFVVSLKNGEKAELHLNAEKYKMCGTNQVEFHGAGGTSIGYMTFLSDVDTVSVSSDIEPPSICGGERRIELEL